MQLFKSTLCVAAAFAAFAAAAPSTLDTLETREDQCAPAGFYCTEDSDCCSHDCPRSLLFTLLPRALFVATLLLLTLVAAVRVIEPASCISRDYTILCLYVYRPCAYHRLC